MFRDAFKRKRCLIPASGYYEWKTTETGKHPYYFSTENGSPLTIAGLWDEWKDIETGEPLGLVHDGHHHRQRVRQQDTRPDARAADALSVRRVAVRKRGGGGAPPWAQKSLRVSPACGG